MDDHDTLIPLPVEQPIWNRFFGVHPLVLIGSKGEDGQVDLAPKHMAMPLGWENFFGFVCTPRHTTYRNIRRTEVFTVGFPRPSDVLIATLAAAPRCEDGTKPSLLVLPTKPARVVDGVVVDGCYVHLECQLHSIQDGFGVNSLIIGKVVAAAVHPDALRDEERDEGEQLYQFPLLTYIHPGRFAEVRQTTAFPFPKGFTR